MVFPKAITFTKRHSLLHRNIQGNTREDIEIEAVNAENTTDVALAECRQGPSKKQQATMDFSQFFFFYFLSYAGEENRLQL